MGININIVGCNVFFFALLILFWGLNPHECVVRALHFIALKYYHTCDILKAPVTFHCEP